MLSVGDEHFQKKSMSRMEELITDKSRTVIIVSHSIETLERLCNRVIWMNDGSIKQMGETKIVLDQYREFMNY